MNRRQNKYAALYGGLAVAATCIHYALIFPLVNASSVVSSETGALHLKLAGYQSSLEMVNSYLKRRDSLNQRRTELTARLYARDDVLALIERLKERSETYNVRVREISPSVVELLAINDRPKADDTPQHVKISLRVSGSATAAGRLLQSLEAEPYFVDLMSLHVVGRERGLAPAEYIIHFLAQLGSLPVETMVSR